MSDYITKEGMQKLQKRLNELIRERPDVIKQVVTAREMGDLSENAEYHAAREKQRNLEKEFNHIKKRVTRLKVVDVDSIPKDAVRFGARVILKELSTGMEKRIFLVGIDEVFKTENEYERMSIASPIGKALIGKKNGDHIVVQVPIGKREFEILSIE